MPVLSRSGGSPADVTNEVNVNMIGQKTYENDFQLQYDVSQYFGLRAGLVWSTNTTSRATPTKLR